MRKITEEAVKAFINRKRFKKNNTEVYIGEFTTLLFLFSNAIAIKYDDGSIEITTCGWNTRTTIERLNGIDGVSIRKTKKQLYLNNEPWDGTLIKIN
jgi:hypothetical protein